MAPSQLNQRSSEAKHDWLMWQYERYYSCTPEAKETPGHMSQDSSAPSAPEQMSPESITIGLFILSHPAQLIFFGSVIYLHRGYGFMPKNKTKTC
jgi:hypothetical protein